MASIPSSSLASVLQTPLAQRAAAAERDAETQRGAEASRQTAALDEQQVSEVENTDSDTRVHADAGGLGGQGRAFDHPADDEADPDADASALPKPPPTNHLDITA